MRHAQRTPGAAPLPAHTNHQPADAQHAALQQELAAYRSAATTLYNWSAGAQALALLRAALDSGVFAAVRTPRTAAQAAATTGLPAERVAHMLAALDAHGAVERAGDSYTISADFARLDSPRAIQPLANILAMERVKAQAIERAGVATRPYTALSTEDQIAVARGVMGLPTSPLWQATFAAMVEAAALPELRAICEAGGRYLELGCGAASGLLTMLVLFPRMTAVGVDLNAAALAEARRRAEEVGVADRVELRLLDARDLRDEACYDLAFWSTHFFPAATRAAALAAAHRALKPGGYLLLSHGGDPPAATEALRQPKGRADALSRLLFSSWGVPVGDTSAAVAELAAAGFTVLQVLPNPSDTLSGMMLAQRAAGRQVRGDEPEGEA